MASKVLKGTLFGGVLSWGWLFASWLIFPSWHCSVIEKFSNESEVTTVMERNTPQSGAYFLPYLCQEKHAFPMEDLEQSPLIFATIQKYATPFQALTAYALALLVQCGGAFLVFLILLQTRHLHYFTKVIITTLIGISIGVLGNFPNWVWKGFPLSYVLVETLDCAIAWLLAGIFMAAFAKSNPPPSSARFKKRVR